MKIKCGKDSLLKGLQSVYHAVSTKNTIFALSGILLEAKDGVFTYKATDMEVAMEYRDDSIVIEQEGSIILPGRYIMEIAKRLPDEEITLYTEGFTVYLQYSGSEITINGYDQEEFPAFSRISGDVSGEFTLDTFRSAVKEVSIAASADESKPAFTGVLFEINGNEVTMVATDTHRLALKHCQWENKGEKESASVLIPAKVLRELAKFTPDEEEKLTMVIGEKQVSFSLGNILLISRLIESKFPNYSSVIPDEGKFTSKAEVGVSHLLSTLERASVMVRDQSRERAGKAKFILENETLTIISQNEEIGKVNESIPVFQEGNDITLVVNSRYFIDFLTIIDTETAVVKFTGVSTSMVMVPKDDDSYLYLALPLKY